jgi:hypothetical protein
VERVSSLMFLFLELFLSILGRRVMAGMAWDTLENK